ncbi:unnamed protein product [Cochlearia groenlandica]
MALGYKPSEDFVVNKLQPLVDFDMTGSKELWLIQCPLSHFPEIDGKEFKVKLDKDGILGGFEDSYGKEVNLMSFASQDADATVIIPSGEQSNIVGKISRRASLVCYPEPKELLETMKARTQQKLVGAATSSSGKYSGNPTQSSRHKSGQSTFRHSAASTRSSKQKSTLTGLTDTPKSSSKRKHSGSSSSKHHSSTTTGSGSSERSKKKVKTEKSN